MTNPGDATNEGVIERLLKPLYEMLPLDEAMGNLVVTQAPNIKYTSRMQTVVALPIVQRNPALAAALWLYVDDLHHSHEISQAINNPTGSFWHMIMHRREGDFENAHYWARRTGEHPAMAEIPGYHAAGFIDAVAAANGQNKLPLLATQRQEWLMLAQWCARETSEH